MIFFDPMYMLFISPALLLMAWAQWRIRSTYAEGMEQSAGLSGAAAARYILDHAGLHDVEIEETPGQLSDHYDPSARVVRLSPDVYRRRTATAVGIAAHEVGHAIQHAQHYLPLVVRNAAVPAAQFGPTLFMILVVLGMVFSSGPLVLLGLACYGGLVVFQIVNLPVEFDASNRAKRILVDMKIIDEGDGSRAVRRVLNAAGWTYVAATLQSLLTFLYYVMILVGRGSSNDDRS